MFIIVYQSRRQLHNLLTSVRVLKIFNIHAPFISRKVSTVDSAPWYDKEYRDLGKFVEKQNIE